MKRLGAAAFVALPWMVTSCGPASDNGSIVHIEPQFDQLSIGKALSEAKNKGDYLFFSIGPGDGAVGGSMQYVLITSEDKIYCTYVKLVFEAEPEYYEIVNERPRRSRGAFEDFYHQLAMAGIQRSGRGVTTDIEGTYKGASVRFNIDYSDLRLRYPGVSTRTDLQELAASHWPECWNSLFG